MASSPSPSIPANALRWRIWRPPRRAPKARGRKVLGVVASACTTSTGSFDPIDAIADFCEARDLWVHVDAAHGASFLLHPDRERWLRGIQRADSVVWDLHKMMLMPALITAVLFREGRRSYEAFAQEASYLFEGHDPQAEWYNIGQRTLECTKRGMGATAYALLAAKGTDYFRDYLDRMLVLTGGIVERLKASSHWELAVDPEVNIVCFRYLFPGSQDAQNRAQVRLRDALVGGGDFYIVRTQIEGVVYLRTTIINPATTSQDLDALLDQLEALAAQGFGGP